MRDYQDILPRRKDRKPFLRDLIGYRQEGQGGTEESVCFTGNLRGSRFRTVPGRARAEVMYMQEKVAAGNAMANMALFDETGNANSALLHMKTM